VSYAARTKYDRPGRAQAYSARSPAREAEEWRLLAGLLDGLERPGRALDLPCGTGRVAERLVERGIPTLCADLSPAMRRETEARLAGREGYLGVEAVDLEGPPRPEHASDLVVCFRFLHHLPGPEARRRVLEHLRGVTRRDLLLSFHHPVSLHNLSRALRRVLTRRSGDRHVITLGRLRREARASGLDLVGARALAAWRRELWVAHLRPAAEAPA